VVLAVLAVAAGIVVFVVVSNKDDPKVVVTGDAGGDKPGEDAGRIAMASPDAAETHAAIDAGGGGVEPPVVADAAPLAAEIDAGGDVTVPIDAGGVAVEATRVLIKVKNVAAFDVYEDGKKLFEGSDMLPVVAGTPRTIVIKARGYKDKKLVVDGRTSKIEVKLAALPGGRDNGSGSATPPPPGVDCRNVVVDPKSKACRKQYCGVHPTDVRCDTEDP
jgi:hypothetical protein